MALIFGQLNKCYTLEDISAGIGGSQTFISDLGLLQSPARSTMSDGNKKRNWQVFEMLYMQLLKYYERVLIAKHQPNVIKELKHKIIKIIDSSTIGLCLKLFNWTKFRTAKGGLKIHTCWNNALISIYMINITEVKVHDSKGHPQQVFAAETIFVEDKGYYDFSLMKTRIEHDNYFVTRIKDNTAYLVTTERPLLDQRYDYILCDEEILITGNKAIETEIHQYALRRIAVYDAKQNRIIELITNNFEWEAKTVSELYKKRWQIELFFKAIKQNLLIKTFTGTSENVVKSQIYVSLICYLLLELLRRNTCKATHAFSNFTEKIRICHCYYLSIDYVCNSICQGAKAISARKPPDLFSSQILKSCNKYNTLKLVFD